MSRAVMKYVGVALVIGGIVLSATGIGAFSITNADRQMFVGVGGKSTSYLGISTSETTVTTNGTNETNETRGVGTETPRLRRSQAGSSTVLGSVTNYFPATLDSIDVTVSKNHGPLTVHGAHVETVPLKSGRSGDLVATIDCGGASHGTSMVTFEFVAEGLDTHATATRTVPVTCVNASQSAPSNPPRAVSSPRQVHIGSA